MRAIPACVGESACVVARPMERHVSAGPQRTTRRNLFLRSPPHPQGFPHRMAFQLGRRPGHIPNQHKTTNMTRASRRVVFAVPSNPRLPTATRWRTPPRADNDRVADDTRLNPYARWRALRACNPRNDLAQSLHQVISNRRIAWRNTAAEFLRVARRQWKNKGWAKMNKHGRHHGLVGPVNPGPHIGAYVGASVRCCELQHANREGRGMTMLT
jgi:hypothetical protein